LPRRLVPTLQLSSGMSISLLVPALVMILPQITKADVDLMSGGFQWQLTLAEGESNQILIFYRSRSTKLSALGIGWSVDGPLPATVQVQRQGRNLTGLKMGQRQWHFAYDEFHNLTEVMNPDRQRTLIVYDSVNDRVQSVHSSTGCTETYTYISDRLRRMTDGTRQCPDQPAEAFKLAAEISGMGFTAIHWFKPGTRLSYRYGSAGQLQQVTRQRLDNEGQPIGFERTRFAYDLNSRLKQITTPENLKIDFAYDSSGRLQSIDGGTLAIALALQAALENLSPFEGGPSRL
jgi:YD repeat-containing protein